MRLTELIEHLQIIAATHGNVAVEFNMADSEEGETPCWREVSGVVLAENNNDEVLRIV